MKRTIKILKQIGIVIGSLVLLLLLTGLITNMIFGRELRQTIRDMKSRGTPFTIAEIVPPLPPEEENAAPILHKATAFITNAAPDDAISKLLDLINGNLSKSNDPFDLAAWPDDQRKTAAELMQSDDVSKLYSLLEGAAGRPHYNNNLDYSQGPSIIVPNLSTYRPLTQLLIFKAAFEVDKGQIDQALNTLLTGLQVSNKLSQEPMLISQMVRLATDSMLIEQIKTLAGTHALPAGPTKKLIAELALRQNISWDATWNMEYVGLGLWVYDTFMHSSAPGHFLVFTALAFGDENKYRGVFPELVARLFFHSGIIKKDMIFYLKTMDNIRERGNEPYYLIADQLRNDPIDGNTPKYYRVAQMMLPNLDAIIIKKNEHQALVGLCRTGLALNLFKEQSGKYPEKLDQLVPQFLDAIPLDPFSGKPPICRLDGNGFILYSLGPDMQDDNGTPQARAGRGKRKTHYDIVWKCAQ